MSKSITSDQARVGGLSTFKYLLVAARPKQWTKNFMLFFGMIFSLNLRNPQMIAIVVASFALFCMLSSGIYLVNDLVDLEKDRLHPLKRARPLASGALSPSVAIVTAFVLLLSAMVLSLTISQSFALVAIAYVALMLAYSYVLKHLVLLDVLALAAGFLLRAVAGAEAIHVPISSWLYVCTILGALLIAFGKRRHELVLLSDEAAAHRPILEQYSSAMLDQLITIVAATTIIAYSLYTFSAENLPENLRRSNTMMLTVPFVIYGVFRYLYLIQMKNAGGTPEEILLKDRPLLLDVVLWITTAAGILYYFG